MSQLKLELIDNVKRRMYPGHQSMIDNLDKQRKHLRMGCVFVDPNTTRGHAGGLGGGKPSYQPKACGGCSMGKVISLILYLSRGGSCNDFDMQM